MATPKTNAAHAGYQVRTVLGDDLRENRIFGVAPMSSGGWPISSGRFFTVTIMMLETPMAPARRVPMPTSQMEVDALEQVVEHLEEYSVLKTMMPFSSVGRCCGLLPRFLIRWAMLLITTPGLPVVAMMSTALPGYQRCAKPIGAG